jgi:hypothetical protein
MSRYNGGPSQPITTKETKGWMVVGWKHFFHLVPIFYVAMLINFVVGFTTYPLKTHLAFNYIYTIFMHLLFVVFSHLLS